MFPPRRSPHGPFFVCLALLGACRAPAVAPVRDAAADDEPVTADAAKPPATADAGFAFTVADAGDASSGGPRPVSHDCPSAAAQKGNAGCSFYPLHAFVPESFGCLAAFVVNPGTDPVKLRLERGGAAVSLAQVARLPRGGGRELTYAPYDEAMGLPGNDVAILFLMMGQDGSPCPRGIKPAVEWKVETPNLDRAFHLTSDRPVIAYQILPYGGAGSHVTSATLLLPEESWGTSYLVPTPKVDFSVMVAVAGQDGTEVTFHARGGAARQVTLAAGQVASFVGRGIKEGLSGSAITASKPVGVIGGMVGEYLPGGSLKCCADSAQQQIAPLSTWGHEYVAVRYRSRLPDEEEGLWQLVGVVAGTTLTYAPAPPPGAPTTLGPGQVVELWSAQPFVVRSQDEQHPFYLAAQMTSSEYADPSGANGHQGDPDFVSVVPAAQYASSYTFFTDPTYPETDLVVVRKRGDDGKFAEVKLACAMAPLSGWKSVGDFEFTRVDLVTGNFMRLVPGCDNGRQAMTSAAPFAVTVWGWGTRAVKVGADDTADTSYGYPAGAGLRPVNSVETPIP